MTTPTPAAQPTPPATATGGTHPVLQETLAGLANVLWKIRVSPGGTDEEFQRAFIRQLFGYLARSGHRQGKTARPGADRTWGGNGAVYQ
jgi:hypothetical protein